jgi:hypothetical protein
MENVQAFFDQTTAQQILQIPISRRIGVDYVSWPHTRHGTFTVRSAYFMARSAKFIHSRSKTDVGISSNWMDSEKQWKSIWKTKAPGKMPIHLWRFAHDCLPSGFQLCKRRVPASGLCVFCDRLEGIEHSLLTCQFARMVWTEVKFHVPIKLDRKAFSMHKQWLFDFLSRSSDIQATVLAVGFWHIWEARNDTRNGGPKSDPKRTCGKILAYVDLIREHLFKPSPVHRCESSSPANRWTPPPPGTVLINSDAALFEDTKSMGAGVVIRDHRGQCIGACRQHLQGFSSPEFAEPLALLRAVSLAREKELDKVIFATDCLSLVQRLHSSTLDRSQVGILVGEIKSLFCAFTEVSFVHVKRNLNGAAHYLAQSCRSFPSSEVFSSVPKCIRETLCIDVI